jgi:capsular exopolysaccharide synthesis family protein
MHNLLNVMRDVGFTNVLMGTSKLEDAVISTEYEGLSFLPAGTLPPNPSEVLSSQPSRDLFKRLAKSYDIVILDCPPAAQLSDVQVISTIVDGMLLLVAINRTFKRGLQFTYRALTQVSAPLIGLVMNRVELHRHRYGYYGYYYGKYDYYSQEGYDNLDDAQNKQSHHKHK